jgi:hypothetical protein
MSDTRWHPASTIFPLLEHNDLEELTADIKAHGLSNPIVMHEGQVLDGRNRLIACEAAGIKPRTVEWSEVKDGHVSPAEWVIGQNLKRRHLTPSQVAAVAAQIALPLAEAEAKERMSMGGKKKGGQISAYPPDEGKAAARVARQFGTNRSYIQAAKEIQATNPELSKEIISGHLSIPAAIKKLRKVSKTSKHVHAPLAPADMTTANDTGAALSIALDHLFKVTLRCIAREGRAAYEVPAIANAWIFLVEYGFTRPELDKPHATGADGAVE